MNPIGKVHKQRPALSVNHQTRPSEARVARRERTRHRPGRTGLVELKPGASARPWPHQVSIPIGEDVIHGFCRQDAVAIVGSIVEDHLTEACSVEGRGEESCVAGDAVE